MAFMGLFMMYLVIVLIILGTSAFICAVCFISSGIIMVGKRKKAEPNTKVKQPWYVIVLRVFGVISALPLIAAAVLIIYAVIAGAVDKRTNLPRAVMSGDYVLAERILKNGADPDMRDKYGQTLLMCITAHNPYYGNQDMYYADSEMDDDADLRMMGILLEYGADINAQRTECGDSSNHEYHENSWTDIYANSDHPCGNTALIFAVCSRNPEIVNFLIDNGADVNQANSCGFTPLLMCADNRSDDFGGFEIATMLIDEGADPKAVTNFHQDINWLLYRRNSEDNYKMAGVILEALE